jgi:hypothetical protein
MAVKVYIAGPMTGYKDLNYPAFNAMKTELQQAGYTPLSPADVDNKGEAQSWEWYMRRTIPMLCEADAVLLLPGWERSKGARIEERIAGELSIPVYESLDQLPL